MCFDKRQQVLLKVIVRIMCLYMFHMERDILKTHRFNIEVKNHTAACKIIEIATAVSIQH